MELLDQFEKRMEFVAAIDSIVNRKNKSSEIEASFEEGEIDNLLLSVLVYIMGITLAEDQDCTIESITGFIKEILPSYNKHFTIAQIEILTRYLVKDILQNKSQLRLFPVMHYGEPSVQLHPVRLIRDKETEERKIVYELTPQGYDLMFRTKEVDEELGFELEEVKLKMLIRKKNYRKAVSQSRELIRMLLNKRKELQQFEFSLRNNISSISGADYDRLIREINSMLQQEYDSMEEINHMIDLAKQRLIEEEQLHGNLDQKTRQAKTDVGLISQNIERALGYQRRLLIECKGMKQLYLNQLEDSIAYSKIKVYPFEKTILKPLEQIPVHSAEKIWLVTKQLMNPLFLPEPDKLLNLNTVYGDQTKIKEDDQDFRTFLEEMEQNEQKVVAEQRNRNHVRIIRLLFQFSSRRPEGFFFSDYFTFLKENSHFHELIQDRMLYLAVLKLFEFQEIDINEWQADKEQTVLECNGEFDLAYCLSHVALKSGGFYGIGKLSVRKTDQLFYDTQVMDPQGGYEERITMNDFWFEVDKNGTSATDL